MGSSDSVPTDVLGGKRGSSRAPGIASMLWYLGLRRSWYGVSLGEGDGTPGWGMGRRKSTVGGEFPVWRMRARILPAVDDLGACCSQGKRKTPHAQRRTPASDMRHQRQLSGYHLCKKHGVEYSAETNKTSLLCHGCRGWARGSGVARGRRKREVEHEGDPWEWKALTFVDRFSGINGHQARDSADSNRDLVRF